MAIVRGVRRFHSRFISSSSRQAATEISNLVCGSNIEQPGRSSVASFTSERPIRRRLSTADRKAMLESFVNKYRDMNMGKFPSISRAIKEVGGGHYVIRKLLQEIEYDFRTSSVEKGLIKDHKKQTEGENTTGMEISTESSGSQDVSNSQITIAQQLCEDPWTVNNFDNHELKEVLPPSTSSANAGRSNIRRDDTRNIESHDMKGCHEKLEQKPKYEFLQSKVENQQDGIRNIATETHDTIVQCYEKLEQKSEQKPKGESPLEDKSVYEDSQSKVEKQPDGIENIATENRDTDCQCHGKVEQKLEDKLIDESPLEDKSVYEDSQSKVEKQPDGIENIATENRDTDGQCHGKVEQKLEDKLIDESPLEENFVSEDLQSKVELRHDGIRDINRDMPEQQKDDGLREKPSLWGNLKSLATDFINMWKK